MWIFFQDAELSLNYRFLSKMSKFVGCAFEVRRAADAIARGQARSASPLVAGTSRSQAPTGRDRYSFMSVLESFIQKAYSSLTGLGEVVLLPRALPWAFILRAFGALLRKLEESFQITMTILIWRSAKNQ